MTLSARLADGLVRLSLSLSQEQQQALLDYVALLHKWNKVYNLTAVREPGEMLTQHLFDSLAVDPYVGPGRLLDVGSGAGLPGIPLAIAKPAVAVTLLDSSHKRTTFLRQAVIELGLRNVTVECLRAEQYKPAQPVDCVISRAFSDLGEFVRLAAGFCRPQGLLLAMKGLYPHDEVARLPPPFAVEDVVALNVPDLAAQRHLVIIRA